MKRRMLWGCVLAAIVSLAFAVAPPTMGADKATLNVFAAASLSDAFTEIGHDLEKQRPGLTVRMNFAGSQQLALQIEQGASADVFASADERWMSYAQDHGRVDGESSIFARNRLVVIVPKTNPARISKPPGSLAPRHQAGDRGRRRARSGATAGTVLKNLSEDPACGDDFAVQVLRNVVSEEENVKSVVGKVQLGEADAGMVYRSDVTPAIARYVKLFEIPERANVIASYPIAPIKGREERRGGEGVHRPGDVRPGAEGAREPRADAGGGGHDAVAPCARGSEVTGEARRRAGSGGADSSRGRDRWSPPSWRRRRSDSLRSGQFLSSAARRISPTGLSAPPGPARRRASGHVTAARPRSRPSPRFWSGHGVEAGTLDGVLRAGPSASHDAQRTRRRVPLPALDAGMTVGGRTLGAAFDLAAAFRHGLLRHDPNLVAVARARARGAPCRRAAAACR